MKSIGDEIRRAFEQALEQHPGPYQLAGREHDPRCTFDRRLAAYLRSTALPHIVIAGYGANKHYPRKLVERAARIVNRRLGRRVVAVSGSCAYVITDE